MEELNMLGPPSDTHGSMYPFHLYDHTLPNLKKTTGHKDFSPVIMKTSILCIYLQGGVGNPVQSSTDSLKIQE